MFDIAMTYTDWYSPTSAIPDKKDEEDSHGTQLDGTNIERPIELEWKCYNECKQE